MGCGGGGTKTIRSRSRASSFLTAGAMVEVVAIVLVLAWWCGGGVGGGRGGGEVGSWCDDVTGRTLGTSTASVSQAAMAPWLVVTVPVLEWVWYEGRKVRQVTERNVALLAWRVAIVVVFAFRLRFCPTHDFSSHPANTSTPRTHARPSPPYSSTGKGRPAFVLSHQRLPWALSSSTATTTASLPPIIP